jgi:prophage regulatory protein
MPRTTFPKTVSMPAAVLPARAATQLQPADTNIAAGSLFLRLPSVMRLTGLGRSTIYRLVASKSFPVPVKLAARAIAWRRSDIEAWSESRPVSMH